MKVKIRMMLEMMIKAAILFCCLAFASAEVQMDTVVTVFSDTITVYCLPSGGGVGPSGVSTLIEGLPKTPVTSSTPVSKYAGKPFGPIRNSGRSRRPKVKGAPPKGAHGIVVL